jgi:hypothetical protein
VLAVINGESKQIFTFKLQTVPAVVVVAGAELVVLPSIGPIEDENDVVELGAVVEPSIGPTLTLELEVKDERAEDVVDPSIGPILALKLIVDDDEAEAVVDPSMGPILALELVVEDDEAEAVVDPSIGPRLALKLDVDDDVVDPSIGPRLTLTLEVEKEEVELKVVLPSMGPNEFDEV